MARDTEDDRELARILAGLGGEPVCRIAVHRYEPEWCAGYLGTIDVHPGDGLLMDTIRDEFGGGRLGLKVMGKGGRYLAHKMVRICAEIHEVGRTAARVHENLSRDRAAVAARDEIAALRDQVAALARRVDNLEKQAKRHEKRQHEAEELARAPIK